MVAVQSSRDASETPTVYCAHCGNELSEGDHTACVAKLELEPPRYCPACRRRMVVQVTPRGWSARCSRHGESSHLTNGTGG